MVSLCLQLIWSRIGALRRKYGEAAEDEAAQAMEARCAEALRLAYGRGRISTYTALVRPHTSLPLVKQDVDSDASPVDGCVLIRRFRRAHCCHVSLCHYEG